MERIKQGDFSLICPASFYNMEGAMVVLLIFFVLLVAIIALLLKANSLTLRLRKWQKEFVNSLSHELKTPLTDIIASADMLKKGRFSDPDVNRSLDVIYTESFRMAQKIDNMLLLSSDMRIYEDERAEVDIEMLLLSLYETYEPICAKEKITLQLQIDDIEYPTLLSSKERIIQILSIFLDNAIQHSGHSPTIQIQLAKSAKVMTIYVVDYGQGIPDQDKPFIFEPFYCGDKSHTAKAHSGLGLSVAKSMTKTLNGKIGVRDTDGSGATFYLNLPLKASIGGSIYANRNCLIGNTVKKCSREAIVCDSPRDKR